MKVAFIIINYNDCETTTKLLNNIKKYGILDLIVVVDNDSTDDSLLQLKKVESGNIKVVKNTSNKGYGSGINFGSRYAMASLGDCRLIISNSDIEIESEEDLKRLIVNFPEDAGIIAPIVKEHSRLNRGWKVPTPLEDGFLNILFLHRWLRRKTILYPEAHYDKDLVLVEAVSGCFFVIDSKCLESVNYFDENIFLYYEENVIAKKLEMLGKTTYVNTLVSVFHNHSVSIDKSIDYAKKYRELKKSQFYFQTEYNNASLFTSLFLKATSQFSYFFLKFVYLFKK